MTLSEVVFNRLKTEVLGLSTRQADDVRLIIQSLSPGRAHTSALRGDPEIYAPLADALALRNKTRVLAFRDLRKTSRQTASTVVSINDQVKQDMRFLFPSMKHLEQHALFRFVAGLATNRVLDQELPLTLHNLLTACSPLTELMDDRFPGYRKAGYLEKVILEHLNKTRKDKPCLGPTPSEN